MAKRAPKTKESYLLTPRGLLGDATHNSLQRYMLLLNAGWKLDADETVAVVLQKDGQLSFETLALAPPTKRKKNGPAKPSPR